jgi:riboflavin kinase/FMN adenylyltransferase
MGFFDGVHRGHRFLIEETKRLAAEKGLPSMLISFWPHPRTVLHSNFCPQLLTVEEERKQLLKETGIDIIYTLEFDDSLAKLSARQFMETILVDECRVTSLVIGFDHRFGNSRTDGLEEYKAFGKEMGMEVIQVKPYSFSKAMECSDEVVLSSGIPVKLLKGLSTIKEPEVTTVSSSLIRRLIMVGNMEDANTALGYPYSLTGLVVGGQHIGTVIGYPTANIEPLSSGKLIPANGVYAVWVELNGQSYKGMLNIGRRPTLKVSSNIVIEVHLLDFSGNLYGQTLTIRFMKRFRQEEQFPDMDALVVRMNKDKMFVESYLG